MGPAVFSNNIYDTEQLRLQHNCYGGRHLCSNTRRLHLHPSRNQSHSAAGPYDIMSNVLGSGFIQTVLSRTRAYYGTTRDVVGNHTKLALRTHLCSLNLTNLFEWEMEGLSVDVKKLLSVIRHM